MNADLFSSLGLPSSFGGSGTKDQDIYNDTQGRLNRAIRPQYLKLKSQNAKSKSDSGSEDDSEDDEFDIDEIPVSHELFLEQSHTQSVTSISVDPAGSRMLSASYDTSINFWDFNGMDTFSHSPFRAVHPVESYQLHSAFYSKDGQRLLAIPRYTKPKLYDRDGKEISEFAAGDMYLVDMKNTKGHTAEMTAGVWSPTSNSSAFATSSYDSTVRIWDVTNTKSQRDVIILRSKGGRGDKVQVTSLEWSDGLINTLPIIAGSSTGSIALWDSNGSFSRPANFIENAHTVGHAVTAISVKPSSHQFATRALDGFIKLWDTRNLKSPILSRGGIKSNSEEGGGFLFDPRPSSGSPLIAGCDNGEIHVIDSSDLQTLTVLDFYNDPKDSNTPNITSLNWHEDLNQIIAGTSNGDIKIFFSPSQSSKGAITVFEKAPKRRHIDDDNSLTTSISTSGLEQSISDQAEIQNERRRLAKLQKQREREGESIQTGQPIQPDKSEAMKYKTMESLNQRLNAKREYIQTNISQSINEDAREELLKYAKGSKRSLDDKNVLPIKKRKQ